jgi:septal ring factor EnvC (AmiA/AmiB activator)
LELEALLESRTNERDIKAKLANEIQEAFEGLKNERDRLKKIAADCAASKSKLDDQVAKQLEHQRQIDAQMVRAETQIELLKEFMLAKIG